VAQDSLGRAFLKHLAAGVTRSLLRAAEGKATAAGAHNAARAVRAGQAILADHTDRYLSEYQRRTGEAAAGPFAHQVRGALFDVAGQILCPPMQGTESAAPPPAECFNRGARARQAGEMGTARYWFGLAADQGDADAQRALIAIEQSARAVRPAADAQGHRSAPDPGQAHQGPPGMDDAARHTISMRDARAEALEVLEVPEGASAPEMRAAYHRLMQLSHPDKGGSTYFAKRLNAARETLGF
jgi:hypothetical protein